MFALVWETDSIPSMSMLPPLCLCDNYIGVNFVASVRERLEALNA